MAPPQDEDLRAARLLPTIAHCPRCRGQLERAPSGTRCQICGSTFPDLARVPSLLRDHDGAATAWRKQLASFRAMMQETRAGIEMDLGRFDLLPSTRRRLDQTLRANEANVATVNALMVEAAIEANPDLGPYTEGSAEPILNPLIQHFQHLFRDWGWDVDGTDENRASMERFARALGGSRDLGKTLVLGAGACRLAYDLHRELAPPLTIALDRDPLMLLVADKVLFGDGIALVELPIDPAEGKAVCERHLVRPGPPPENFVLLLADAFAAPFPSGAFDSIVTPWFVDIASDDLRNVIAVVHHLLRVGGRWINQGPLLYPTSSFGRRYTKEEFIELLALGGFEVQERMTERACYLLSPASDHARLESVFSFGAIKIAQTATSPDPRTPVWILLPHLPVPRFAGLESAPPHPVFQEVVALVDGRRSLDEIAHVLSPRIPLPPTARPVELAGALLLKLWQDAINR